MIEHKITNNKQPQRGDGHDGAFAITQIVFLTKMLTRMVIQNRDILSILMVLGSMQLLFCSIFHMTFDSYPLKLIENTRHKNTQDIRHMKHESHNI